MARWGRVTSIKAGVATEARWTVDDVFCISRWSKQALGVHSWSPCYHWAGFCVFVCLLCWIHIDSTVILSHEFLETCWYRLVGDFWAFFLNLMAYCRKTLPNKPKISLELNDLMRDWRRGNFQILLLGIGVDRFTGVDSTQVEITPVSVMIHHSHHGVKSKSSILNSHSCCTLLAYPPIVISNHRPAWMTLLDAFGIYLQECHIEIFWSDFIDGPTWVTGHDDFPPHLTPTWPATIY